MVGGSLGARIGSVALAAGTLVVSGGQFTAAGGATTGTTPHTRVVSWGANGNGALGNGTDKDAHQPTRTVGLFASTTKMLSGGAAHSLALGSGEQVKSWGANDEGQLGNGSNGTDQLSPNWVVGPGGTGRLQQVTQVAAGDVDSIARRSDGTAWMWGDNIWGQLGVGTATGPDHCPRGPVPASETFCSKVPVEVQAPGGSGPPTHVAQVVGGEDNGVAVRGNGTVWSWGLNDEGQLGIGNSTGPEQCKPFSHFGPAACSTRPMRVLGVGATGRLSRVVQVAAGEGFFIALRSDGTLRAWGSDRFATLGQATPPPEKCDVPFFPAPTPCSTSPLPVAGPNGQGMLTGIVAVSADPTPLGLHVLALRADGTVWAWGVDDMGQLGNGQSEEFSNLPVEVLNSAGSGPLEHVVAIAAGGKFSMARTSDGRVWSWGINSEGELGIGNNTGPDHCTTGDTPCSTLPVQVVNLRGTGALQHVQALATGESHTLALLNPGP